LHKNSASVAQNLGNEDEPLHKICEHKEYIQAERNLSRKEDQKRKELPTGGAILADDCLPGDRRASDSQTSNLLDSEDPENSADDAPRRRLNTTAAIEAARERSLAQRDSNIKRDSARKSKAMNLQGTEGVNDPKYGRLVTQLQRDFAREYKASFPEAPLAKWAGKEKGQIKMLVEKYSGQQVSSGLNYVVTNWERISKRFGRKAGVPTPGFLLTFHSDLIPEAVRWSRVEAVKREYDEWRKANPKVFNVPADLKRRYAEVKSELEALGLV
jgi:hypothetical protein